MNKTIPSDYDDVLNNILLHDLNLLPGVFCPVCSETWSSFDRIRVKLPRDPHIRKMVNIPPVDLDVFQNYASIVSSSLSIPIIRITPGCEIGLPNASINKPYSIDIIELFSGIFWVNQNVKELVEHHNLTGIRFVNVTISDCNQSHKIYEIDVFGAAWRVGSTPQNIIICKNFSRKTFHKTKDVIDTDHWDGSDFFCVDQNPNILFVTERVCDIFDKYHLRNLSFTSVPSLLKLL